MVLQRSSGAPGRRPGAKQFGQIAMRAARAAGVVPRGQFKTLSVAQQVVFADAPVRFGQHAVDQCHEAAQQTLRGGGGEQFARVTQVHFSERIQIHADRQFELRRKSFELERFKLQPGEVAECERRVHQVEHHLHERRAQNVARQVQRLHQLFERSLLVGIGLKRGLLHLLEQVRIRRRTRQIAAHHERIDQRSDQRLGMHPQTVGDRRGHCNVVLAADAGHQQLEAREQHHERRGTMAATEFLQTLDQRRLQANVHAPTPPFERAVPREVGGQRQRFHARQARAPIGHLLLARHR